MLTCYADAVSTRPINLESYECEHIPHPSGYGTNLGKAHCQRVMISIDLTPYRRFVEGPWSAVSQAIHDCHAAVHAQGAPRIATDIRIGTRTDREAEAGKVNEGKVKRVEDILAKEKTGA